MRTETINTIKALLFQGDTTGNALPPDLVEAFRIYEDFLRSAWMEDLSPREALAFIVHAIESHREEPRYELGQEIFIPSRNQTVWFLRHAPWGCLLVKDSSETRMLVVEHRVQAIFPEPVAVFPEPVEATVAEEAEPTRKKKQPQPA